MADNGALLAHLGSRDGLGACRGKERCAARGIALPTNRQTASRGLT